MNFFTLSTDGNGVASKKVRSGPCNDEPAVESRLVAAMEEVMNSIADGQQYDRAALLEEYSDIAAELKECLDNLDFIRNVAPQLADETVDCKYTAGVQSSLVRPATPAANIGEFRIVREIGRGGMGVVYEAEQLSLNRRVALKVLPFAAMLDKQQLARFKNEARAAATLDHSNIVAIHSVGADRGVHYYAMQLIEGQSLAELIAALRQKSVVRSPLSAAKAADSLPTEDGQPATDDSASCEGRRTTDTQPLAVLSTLPDFNSRGYYRAIARLGIQAAEALDHAHQNGVLHRDIKPANLLVDDSGKLWITDFGLARIEQDAGLTMTGDLLGTLRYMSPEQALAKRVVVDHRSDIYSLGVTLYELLTLRPAFDSENRHELLRQLAFDEPTHPRRTNSKIPMDLENIVLKAIEKNPVDRYSTAQELADDLRRFSEGRTIQARRPSLLNRARKFVARHRVAATILLVSAFLLANIATALVVDRRRQRKENNRFVAASIEAARTALEANNVEESLRRIAEAQARIDGQRRVDPYLVTNAKSLQKELERYAKFSQLYQIAKRSRSGDYESIRPARDCLALYQVMDSPRWLQALQEAQLPKTHIDRVKNEVYELLLERADHLTRWSSKDPNRKRDQRKKAVAFLEKAASIHPPTRGYYWLMANCALLQGDRDKASKLRAKALETPAQDPAEQFYITRDRWSGTVSKYRGYPEYKIEDIIKDHREMLRLDPTYYNAMFFMGLRLGEAQRYDEALVAWYACVMVRPSDYVAILNRAETHSRLGHLAEAKADIESALGGAPESANVLEFAAMLLAQDRNEDLRDGKRAVELAQKACELTNYLRSADVYALAVACAEVGDFELAVKWCEAAVGLCQKTWLRNEYRKHIEMFRQHKTWWKEERKSPKLESEN